MEEPKEITIPVTGQKKRELVDRVLVINNAYNFK